MPERSDLDRRLRAVERALTDGDHDVAALTDAAAIADRLDDMEARLDALEARTADLDAATQAVRGYVGNVRSVNDEIESRADAALAAVDRIEARLDEPGPQAASGRQTDSRKSVGGRTDHAADSAATHLSVSANDSGSVASEAYGIEMPSPEAQSAPSNRDDPDDGDDVSVIDRVREAL